MTSLSWSEIVSTSTRVSGAMLVIWRVASTPRHPGHVQVHHDDVRRELADRADRLGARRRLADDLDALLLEQVAKPGSEEVVVVDDQDAECVLPTPRSSPASCVISPGRAVRGRVYCPCSVTVTVRRPQASASASDGNQRSISRAVHGTTGVRRDGLAVAGDRHARAERDHGRVDGGDAPADWQPGRGAPADRVAGGADRQRLRAAGVACRPGVEPGSPARRPRR